MFLAKALEPSSWAAKAHGPKQGICTASSASLRPSTRGSSGTGNHQPDLVLAGKRHNPFDIVVLDGDIGAQHGCSAIARSNEKLVQQGALTDFPGQGVFASSGPNNKNIQGILL
jgi:hypothetical protein